MLCAQRGGLSAFGDTDCSLCPSDDDRDIYEPLDMTDTWLMFRCVEDRKDWGSCRGGVVSMLAVGTTTMDRKGGS